MRDIAGLKDMDPLRQLHGSPGIAAELTQDPPGLELGVGAFVAIAPNGEVAYVTSQFGQTIMPIDLTNGLRGDPIRVGQDPPQEIVIVG